MTWTDNIKNNVGSETLSHRLKVISDDICNELCTIMEKVNAKSQPLNDTSIVPSVFHSSFLVDPKCLPRHMEDMVITWVNIDYDRDIVDAIFNKEL